MSARDNLFWGGVVALGFLYAAILVGSVGTLLLYVILR